MMIDRHPIRPHLKGAPREKAVPDASLRVQGLDLDLSNKAVLRDISFSLPPTGITTLIGPSGAGKSSLLRCLNGLYTQWRGEIRIQGIDARAWPGGGDTLRRHVGLIAQKPTVFPCSIRDNVIFGIRGWRKRRHSAGLIEACLRQSALWNEVKDRLSMPAATLSVGQQQRLCLARALAVQPGVLLLDEPTASLDPRSRQMIEDSLRTLARRLPVFCVSHDLEQVRRLVGQVIFMCDGRIIESGPCEAIFAHPERLQTREFFRWAVCNCTSLNFGEQH